MLFEKLMTAGWTAAFLVCAVLVRVHGLSTTTGVVAFEMAGIFAVIAGMSGLYWWLGRRDERRHEARKREQLQELDRLCQRLRSSGTESRRPA